MRVSIKIFRSSIFVILNLPSKFSSIKEGKITSLAGPDRCLRREDFFRSSDWLKRHEEFADLFERRRALVGGVPVDGLNNRLAANLKDIYINLKFASLCF